ncbi:class II fructose-bisphosphate aldolase [Thermodesulfovibrio sp. 1176]|uniref:class II fructose-bisphosphate aldolase n=1 Tax=Thermodesulfovibrio sp. 1176 TaxID=3043424 RepID=UPI002482DF09|nr:class II fructose-bisphosphate aldolase [Thermodesulfovibrio sp. 1176]MDI1472820.1 class II fructose-bisphosphate aldolase [Thermodesulfovibrio sp. 1176]
MAFEKFTEVVEIKEGIVKVKNKESILKSIDELIFDAVFEESDDIRTKKLLIIKEIAKEMGAIPSSIQGLYEEMGKNFLGFTVPAINIRGLTYDVARAIFRKSIQQNVGALIFEIARSEIGYTKQRPLEYSACVLAAAVKEGFIGPVFLQGDHFQIVRRYFEKDPVMETNYVKGLIKEAIEAEFYNIDIDTSTLVDLSKETIYEQQRPNFENTARLTEHVRNLQPEGITISIGGEIGEIGGKNSTPEEARAYLDGFKEVFKGEKGLSKLSVQTGTKHGGVVLPDGSIAQVKIDFDTLKTLSDIVRKEYGLSGCVQHGASTLPEEAFDKFPETGTSEIHLATGFQNIIYDSKHLPDDFRKMIYDYLKKQFASEWKEGQTEEQFIYSTRKKGFGPFKKEWWSLPKEVKEPIMQELEQKFELLFEKLRVVNTFDIVKKTVIPVKVPVKIEI